MPGFAFFAAGADRELVVEIMRFIELTPSFVLMIETIRAPARPNSGPCFQIGVLLFQH
jgi:hypothetical protein